MKIRKKKMDSTRFVVVCLFCFFFCAIFLLLHLYSSTTTNFWFCIRTQYCLLCFTTPVWKYAEIASVNEYRIIVGYNHISFSINLLQLSCNYSPGCKGNFFTQLFIYTYLPIFTAQIIPSNYHRYCTVHKN